MIFIVGDYGAGDLAFSEVKVKIRSRIRHADMEYVSVPPFSTVATGFCIYQLVLDWKGEKEEYPPYIFSNTAPRRDNPNPRKENEGEGLVYAKLDNGEEILAVNSGSTLSFVKEKIKDLRAVNVATRGSQFRSRDKFPRAVAAIVNGDYSILGKKLDKKKIPKPERDVIAYIDGYGNLKLTTRLSEMQFKYGDKVSIEISGKTLSGAYAEDMFGVKEGELVISQGSSGPLKDRFMQVSIRLGNAWERFGRPKVEEKISVRRIANI